MVALRSLLAVSLLLGAIHVVGASELLAAETVTLRLEWSWWAGHAPFFVAQEKGFYSGAGLDVVLQQGQGSGSTTVVVGEGKDNFGHLSQAATAQSVSRGVPITALATFWQKGPVGLISLQDSNIKVPKDVVGKRIGSTPVGQDAQVLPAFLAANKIDPSQVTVVNMPGEAKFAALMAGKVDAVSGDSWFYAPRIEAQGKKWNEIVFADWGVNSLSYGLVANSKFLQEKPDVVRRFVAATIKGYEYTFENPDEAVQIFIKKTDNTQPVSFHKYTLLHYQKQLHTKNTQGKPFGWQSDTDWEEMLTFLEKYGGMTGRKPVNTYFTNAFLPRPQP